VREWDAVSDKLSELSPSAVVGAELLALVGLGAGSLTWRGSLHELGSSIGRIAAGKVYLVGQLGKYVPGSVWALVLQTELGKRAGVPRSRAFTAGLVAVGVNGVTGLAIGLLALSTVASSSIFRGAAVVTLLVLGLVACSPPVLTREINLLLRLVRRPQLEGSVSWRGLSVVVLWSLVSWVTYGLAVFAIAVDAGADASEALPLCLGGVTLAMTVGVIAVVAPSGIGVREAVLVAALAPVLSTGSALAVALVARALFTLADLLAAALSLALARFAQPRVSV
jgi:glycosyltransferase 2 family protein